jgi:hypothetical protein
LSQIQKKAYQCSQDLIFEKSFDKIEYSAIIAMLKAKRDYAKEFGPK